MENNNIINYTENNNGSSKNITENNNSVNNVISIFDGKPVNGDSCYGDVSDEHTKAGLDEMYDEFDDEDIDRLIAYTNRDGKRIVRFPNGIILGYNVETSSFDVMYGSSDFGYITSVDDQDENVGWYIDSIGHTISYGDYLFCRGNLLHVEDDGSIRFVSGNGKVNVNDLSEFSDEEVVLVVLSDTRVKNTEVEIIKTVDGRLFAYNSSIDCYIHVGFDRDDD